MSVSYFIRYEGSAENMDAFLANYRERHCRILAAFPGIERIVLHTPAEWHDPFPVNAGQFVLLAQLVFPTLADLQRALASEARARAREDFQNFPLFTGTIQHQAAFSDEVFRT
jgi:uncharacterized protein (TIGR02118 family)